MAKDSPTQRTLKMLRAARYTVAITERWNPHAKLRQDLFGFIDLVGIHPDNQGVLAVQTTSGSNHSARRAKILALPAACLWVLSGNRIFLISWSTKGKSGKRKIWEPRVENITIGMFSEATESAMEQERKAI